MRTETQDVRCIRRRWRSLLITVGVVGAMGVSGVLGPVAQAAQKDAPPGAAVSAAAKAKAPKDKGAKKQGPFVTVSGTVTNSLSGAAIEGASVTFAAGAGQYGTLLRG